MNSRKKRNAVLLKRALVVILTVAVLLCFILFDKDVQQIDEVLRTMSPLWLLGALICVLIYYIGDTAVYLLACRDMGIPQKFHDGLLTTMIGFFYSALTPLSSGGQPFQVIQMRSRGISVGTATSVLMIKFMAWHIALTFYGLLGVVFCGGLLLSESTTFFIMFLFGFLVHAFCAGMGFLLMIRPEIVERGGNAVVGWVGRTFLKKHPERAESMQRAWAGFVEEYAKAARFALSHKGGMVQIVVTAFLEVAGYMATTYFIYRGLGFSEVGFFTLFFMQCLLHISVAFVPLPGASGASEGGFYAVFTRFFGGSRLAGMLIWRALTYYFAILFGLLAVCIDGFRKSRRRPPADEPPAEAPQLVPAAAEGAYGASSARSADGGLSPDEAEEAANVSGQ